LEGKEEREFVWDAEVAGDLGFFTFLSRKDAKNAKVAKKKTLEVWIVIHG
jgi:hypothetical protein